MFEQITRTISFKLSSLNTSLKYNYEENESVIFLELYLEKRKKGSLLRRGYSSSGQFSKSYSSFYNINLMIKRQENHIKKHVERGSILHLLLKVNLSWVPNTSFFPARSKLVFDVIFSLFMCEKWKGWTSIFIQSCYNSGMVFHLSTTNHNQLVRNICKMKVTLRFLMFYTTHQKRWHLYPRFEGSILFFPCVSVWPSVCLSVRMFVCP